MKLEKRIDKEHHIDIYILSIPHKEADEAFNRMTPLQKGMIADLQQSERISTMLKVLTFWAQRIEDSKLEETANV